MKYSLRNKSLNPSRKKKKAGQKCYSVFSIKIYNSMPINLKNISDKKQMNNTWVNKIKNWLSSYKIVNLQ